MEGVYVPRGASDWVPSVWMINNETVWYFIFTSLSAAPNPRPRILSKLYMYVPLVLGHSLAHYLLSLVEATVVVADNTVVREGVGYCLLVVALVGMLAVWEAHCSGVVMISRASALVLLLSVAMYLISLVLSHFYLEGIKQVGSSRSMGQNLTISTSGLLLNNKIRFVPCSLCCKDWVAQVVFLYRSMEGPSLPCRSIMMPLQSFPRKSICCAPIIFLTRGIS